MSVDKEQDVATQDLAGLVSRFRRHIPISIAIVVAMVVIAYGATKLMKPKYTATAQLVYAPQAAIARDGQGAASPPQVSDQQRDAAIDAQIQAATSLPVARQALEMSDVGKDPEIQSVARSFDPTTATPGPDVLAAALLANVDARRVAQTSLFGVSYTSPDPVKAAKFANVLAAAFLAVNARQKLGLNSGSMDDLKKQVALLQKKAQDADQAVAAFRLQHHLLVDPNSTQSTFGNPLPQIDTQLAQARGDAAQAQARGAASGSTVVSGSVDTSALSALQEQRAQASGTLASLSAHYGPRNPQVVAAQEQVADLDAAIRREMASVSRGVQAESSAATARASSIAGSKAQTEGQIANSVRNSVQLAALQRTAEDAHSLYTNLLASLGQQQANLALVQPDAQILTPAVPPLSPSSPRPLINLVVGFAFGLAIAVGLAYLRERWSQKISTIDDVYRLLGVDYVSSVPTLRSSIDKPKTGNPAEAVILHPMSSYAESFRSLAQSLIFDARKEDTPGGRVIGVGSALPGEGKTTTAISIARVLAMGATKVALVDADLRRRSITMTLAPQTEKGWIDVLNGDAALSEVMLDDQTGAKIFPLAPGAEKASRVFDGDGFKDLIARLRKEFEVVIIDTAPVLALVDTRSITPHLDSFALLAHWRTTPVKAIRAALHQLDTVGAPLLGVVISMVNLKTQAQSGYGDASYYYHEMKEYYTNT